MTGPTTQTELLKTHEAELVKTHQSFDASNRLEYVYTASAYAVNGAPCLVTRYSYDGVSSRILYYKEYYGTWNSSWDVF
jgi:hypothetical protein